MTHTLTGITPAKYAEIGQTLFERTGLKLVGNEGKVEKSGFVVSYRYDSAAETVEVSLVSKPWFIPQSIVDREVQKFIEGTGKHLLSSAPAQQP